MFFRLFSLALTFCVLSFNEGYAGSPKKRDRSYLLQEKENNSPNKKLKKNHLTPQITPTKEERNANRAYREEMVLLEYPNGKEKKPVESPIVRKVISKFISDNSFEPVLINNKYVIQNDTLFDPHALVLNESKEFESNLLRMKRGLCPVSHRGISKTTDPTGLTNTEIKKIHKKQKNYRIELQHMTQKDSGKIEDSLIEMTHVGHHGKNARIILRLDKKSKKSVIVASDLKKKEAEAKLAELNDPDCFIVTNVLHFRKGSSLINRTDFDPWRVNYWKTRSASLEEPEIARSLFTSSEDTSGE